MLVYRGPCYIHKKLPNEGEIQTDPSQKHNNAKSKAAKQMVRDDGKVKLRSVSHKPHDSGISVNLPNAPSNEDSETPSRNSPHKEADPSVTNVKRPLTERSRRLSPNEPPKKSVCGNKTEKNTAE